MQFQTKAKAFQQSSRRNGAPRDSFLVVLELKTPGAMSQVPGKPISWAEAGRRRLGEHCCHSRSCAQAWQTYDPETEARRLLSVLSPLLTPSSPLEAQQSPKALRSART